MQGMVWTACKSFSKKVTLPFSLSKLQVYCNFCSNDLLHAEQPWSSGMMLACHAGDPGSIPGGCNAPFAAFRRLHTWAHLPYARSPLARQRDPSRRLQRTFCGFCLRSAQARIPSGCSSAVVFSLPLRAASDLPTRIPGGRKFERGPQVEPLLRRRRRRGVSPAG